MSSRKTKITIKGWVGSINWGKLTLRWRQDYQNESAQMEEMSIHETINKQDGSLIYHKASSLRKRNRSDPPHKERKDEDRRRRHIFRLGIDFFCWWYCFSYLVRAFSLYLYLGYIYGQSILFISRLHNICDRFCILNYILNKNGKMFFFPSKRFS